MNLKERIVKELDKNSNRSSETIAKLTGASPRYVRNVRPAEGYKDIPKDGKPRSATIDMPTTVLKTAIKEHLKKKDVQSVSDLADHFDTGPTKIKDVIKELIKEGHTIKLDDGMVLYSTNLPKAAPFIIDIRKMSTNTHKFGACGDPHLCSNYERLDLLNALYDEYQRQGIKIVYNTGNWIDGEARFNKHDLKCHGIKNQLEYFVKNYPQRDGITTYFVAGDDHEGWYVQREGLDIGKLAETTAIAHGRKDLVYLGYMEADVVLKAKNGKTIIRVLHPGGGSSYAISYTSQKIVESYTSGEKPHVLLVGHYHKAEYLFNRGVHIVQTGTTQDQTPFMRKKRLAAHLGGWIIEMATDDNGAITRFKQEFMPFYDNEYYTKWKHLWK